jgi:signal transduction histidine kinase
MLTMVRLLRHRQTKGAGTDMLDLRNTVACSLLYPFLLYQIGNSKMDAAKGFGLGLSIVLKLSKILDLQINVASKIDIGTRFIITVPTGKQIAVQT